jgi:hypothetical protein
MEAVQDHAEVQFEETSKDEAQQMQEDPSSTIDPSSREDSQPRDLDEQENHDGKSRFVHGLLVGIGMGSVAVFVIVWVTLFFIPEMPASITYENLLSIFIYPLVYLLTVGLVAMTAGIVSEYYVRAKT